MNIKDELNRAIAYLRLRKRQYQLTFTSPSGQDVLIDLASFCRANESCFHEDPRKHAVLEGRREVWLRIQQHIKFDEQQLYALYGGNQFNMTQEENRNAD